MLEFVLDDGTGWLSAGLWKDEAVSLCHETTDTYVTTDSFGTNCLTLFDLLKLSEPFIPD